MADNDLRPEELASILVIYLPVGNRADAEARRLLDDVTDGARNDDPDLEPWLVRNVSGPLLQRAGAFIAGLVLLRGVKPEAGHAV